VSTNTNDQLISIITINEPTTNALTGYAVRLNANQNVSTPKSIIVTVAQPASGNYASATANITLIIYPVPNPTIARWFSGTGTVYSADAANQSTGAATMTPPVPSGDFIFSMVSNETHLFYTTMNGTSIFRIPLDGSTTNATTFYSQSQGGRFLTVGCIDLTYLYWIDMTEMNIYRVPLASASLPVSKPSTPFVQTGITSDFTQLPQDYTLVCAVDASYIYWNTPNTSTSSGYVARANLNGTMSINNTFKLVSSDVTTFTFANELASPITRSGFVIWSNYARNQFLITNGAFSLSYYSDEFQPGPPNNIKSFTFRYQGLIDAFGIGSLAVNNNTIYWGYYTQTGSGNINNNISRAIYFDNNGFKTDMTQQDQSGWITNPQTSTASNSNPIQSLCLTTPAPTAVTLDSISTLQQGSTTLRNLNATVSILNNQTLTIPQGITIQIQNGSTLTVDIGGSIMNNGTITNDGTITINGTITNNAGGSVNNVSGTINNNSNTIINYANITNTGTFNNNSGGNITNNSTGNITNTKRTITNPNDGQQVQLTGIFTNANGGIINNIGTLVNDGGIFANNGTINGNPLVTLTPAPQPDTRIGLGFNPSSPVTYEANKMIQLTITNNESSFPLSSYSVSTNNSTLTSIITLAGPTDDVTGYVVKLQPNQTVANSTSVIITVTHTPTGNYNRITLVINPPPNPVKYVGVGSQPVIATYNGTVWTSAASAASQLTIAYGVAYNPSSSKWVAVGLNNSSEVNRPSDVSIIWSNNGTTWTKARNAEIMRIGNGVAYGQGRWVAVGAGANTIVYSDDGENWNTTPNTTAIMGAGSPVNGVAYNSTSTLSPLWIAVGGGYFGNTTSIASSVNGINWTPVENSTSILSVGNSIACGENRWVAVGRNGVSNSSIIYSEDNGGTWNPVVNSKNTIMNEGYCVAYNALAAKKWIAGGSNFIASSDDGKVWTRSQSTPSGLELGANPNNNGIRSIAYNVELSKWIALGFGDKHTMISSVNGTEWALNGTFFNTGYGIAASNYVPPQ
jgi:hypothetical protein